MKSICIYIYIFVFSVHFYSIFLSLKTNRSQIKKKIYPNTKRLDNFTFAWSDSTFSLSISHKCEDNLTCSAGQVYFLPAHRQRREMILHLKYQCEYFNRAIVLDALLLIFLLISLFDNYLCVLIWELGDRPPKNQRII